MSGPFSLQAVTTPDELSRVRREDVTKFENLPQVLIQGRKISRTPSASNDVVAGDYVGDINFTASYLYVLIDNSGTPAWRRVALASW